ncbi:sugar ABC transporter permease [Gracilibacillus boraciitolerans JCM 21714]|uniref:Sugar ABC transporter permease n=1 Tax=Gracilibacillus boraciitolerans JCM 21714 TaxID=1298598 RepID=W4VGY6_9BACI|nr:sugar ABC transporter permease [Gracilibacillus boraciitolerans JCM 21714]
MAQTDTALKTTKKSSLSEKRKEALSAYLYISPFFILFAIFGLFPILFSFYLGFQKWNGLGEMEFVGLQILSGY